MDDDIPEHVSDNINGVLLSSDEWIRVVLDERACLLEEVLADLLDECRCAENRGNDLLLGFTFSGEETVERIR